MIIISSITLPTFVYTVHSFLIAVEVIELPDDYIRYCGTFYAGQGVILP